MSEIVYLSITLLKSLVVGALAFQILPDLALALTLPRLRHSRCYTYMASLTGAQTCSLPHLDCETSSFTESLGSFF